MTTAKDSWNEFGSKLSDLGSKLKMHYEREHEASDAQGEEQGEELGEELGERLESLGDTIKDAFEALGNAFEDETLRSDVKEAGRLLIDAMDATFTEVGDELKDKFRR